jgi:hypothetical protein
MRRELASGDATQCGFPSLLVAFRPFLLTLIIDFREITYATFQISVSIRRGMRRTNQ